jgi:hypothetical protein
MKRQIGCHILFLTSWVLLTVKAFVPPQRPRGPPGWYSMRNDGHDEWSCADGSTPWWKPEQHMEALDESYGTTIVSNASLPRGGSTIRQTTKVKNYWGNAFASLSTRISRPFETVKLKLSNRFKSEEQKQQEDLMEKLRNMPVVSYTLECIENVIYITCIISSHMTPLPSSYYIASCHCPKHNCTTS